MKTPDVERRLLDWLWPVRPFDAAIVGSCAVIFSVFWTPGIQGNAWLGIWAGASLGLAIVLTRVRRRARRGLRPVAEPAVGRGFDSQADTIDRPSTP